MPAPSKKTSYNGYIPKKQENYERSWEPSYVREETLRALDELELISTWDQFVDVCEAQKKKRSRPR